MRATPIIQKAPFLFTILVFAVLLITDQISGENCNIWIRSDYKNNGLLSRVRENEVRYDTLTVIHEMTKRFKSDKNVNYERTFQRVLTLTPKLFVVRINLAFLLSLIEFVITVNCMNRYLETELFSFCQWISCFTQKLITRQPVTVKKTTRLQLLLCRIKGNLTRNCFIPMTNFCV